MQESIDDGRRNPCEVVGGVIRLKPDAHPPRQAHRPSIAGYDPALGGDEDQVLITHQLADGGHHLGRQTAGRRRQRCGVGPVVEQPVAELAHGHRTKRPERAQVMLLEDQPGDHVVFPRHDHFLKEPGERQTSEAQLGSNPLLGARRSNPCKHITGAKGCCTREQCAKVRELMRSPSEADPLDSHRQLAMFIVTSVSTITATGRPGAQRDSSRRTPADRAVKPRRGGAGSAALVRPY